MTTKDWFIQNADSIFTESYRLNLKNMPIWTEDTFFIDYGKHINSTTWMTNLCITRNAGYYDGYKCSTKVNNYYNGTSFARFYRDESQYFGYANSDLGPYTERSGTSGELYGYILGYGGEESCLITQDSNGNIRLCGDNELGQLSIPFCSSSGSHMNIPQGMLLFAHLKYNYTSDYHTTIDYSINRYRLIYVPINGKFADPLFIDLSDFHDGGNTLYSYFGADGPGSCISIDARVKILLMYNHYNFSVCSMPSQTYFSATRDTTSGTHTYSGMLLFINNINGWGGYSMTVNNCNYNFGIKMACWQMDDSYLVDEQYAPIL